MKSKAPEIPWVRPRQARGHESMNRMLDATQALLEDVHFDDLTVHDVVEASDTSIGSFYNRFKSKDGLLHCLRERYEAERRETVTRLLAAEEWRGVGLAPRVEAVLHLILRFNRERRGLFRTLRLRQLLGYDALTEGDFVEHARLCRGYYEFFLERREEMAHPAPERAVPFAFFTLVTLLDQRILFDHTLISRQLQADDGLLVAELQRQFLAYLGAPLPALPDRGPSA